MGNTCLPLAHRRLFSLVMAFDLPVLTQLQQPVLCVSVDLATCSSVDVAFAIGR